MGHGNGRKLQMTKRIVEKKLQTILTSEKIKATR
jgi:hypothetical protein